MFSPNNLRIVLFLQIYLFLLNTVLSQKAFGESCLEGESCIGNLECYNNRCGCHPENQTFSNSSYLHWYISTEKDNEYLNETVPAGRCVTRIGHPCLPNEKQCVKGAICRANRICDCEKHFQEESPATKECRAPHAFPCNENDLCLDTLSCVNGRCECPNKEYQLRDGNTCLGIVGTLCQENEKCVKGAICQNSTNWGKMRCECGEGYIETRNSTCERKFGASCDYEEEEEKCDTEAKLVCRNGVCGCANQDDVYQARGWTRACYKGVGYPCENEDQCVGFAKCISIGLIDRCKCRDQYHQAEDSLTCVRK